MNEFKRGQTVFVTMPSGTVKEGFIKGIPGDTYQDSDGDTITLVDRYWVKMWSDTGARGSQISDFHRAYSTVRVPADRLQPRESRKNEHFNAGARDLMADIRNAGKPGHRYKFDA